MLLYQPSALLRPPLGAWSAVSWTRPDQEVSGYRDLSDQFRVPYSRDKVNPDLSQEVYDARLEIMKPLIVAEGRRRFGSDVIIKSLTEIVEDGEEEDGEIWENVLVIGTLFKMMERDQSYLTELGKELETRFEPQPRLYTCEQNTVMMEDERRRMRLAGCCLDPEELVTGVVVGAWGRLEDGRDEFWVEDLVFARIMSPREAGDGGCEEELDLCVMSGLEVGTEECEWLVSAQLAADWMLGSVSSPRDQRQQARIERLIVAGDSFGTDLSLLEDWFMEEITTFTTQSAADAGSRQLDELLAQIVAGLNTDIMPGQRDPVEWRMPQQPLNKEMFRLAGLSPSLNCVTNPYTCLVGGRVVTAVSGQTITDIVRNSSLSPLDAMEKCLTWGHLAPTALDSVRYREKITTDTLVLLTMPDIFIAGNQPEYLVRKTDINDQPVLLVAVPKFSRTESLVRLNLNRLTSQLVSFSTQL